MGRSRNFNWGDFCSNTVNWWREQEKWKLALGALFVAFIIYATFINPKNASYMKEVEEEVRIARQVCLNSEEWVMKTFAKETERLKMNKSILDFIEVNDEIPEFEHVDTPRIFLFSDGYGHKLNNFGLFCSFKDPRGRAGHLSSSYFYDYLRREWVDRQFSRF